MASSGRAPNTADERALLEWLSGRPKEVAVIIAARASLRSLPVALASATEQLKDHSNERAPPNDIALPLFRATMIASLAAVEADEGIVRAAVLATSAADAAVKSANAKSLNRKFTKNIKRWPPSTASA